MRTWRCPLRYGENPHQSAALYSDRRSGIAGAEQLHGKELSYNNLVDLDAAWQLFQEFDAPASAIIKHTNPCGCAEARLSGRELSQGLRVRSCVGLRRSAGVQPPAGRGDGAEIAKTFIEAIAAPDYSAKALAILAAKKNLRLLKVANPVADALVIKSISGGFLAQTADLHKLDRAQAQVKTERAPTEDEWAALGVRLEGLEAREEQRHRVRAGGPDRRRRARVR